MKITVDVECSPQEARSFLGLPDVAPMQEAMMQQIQDRMTANMQAMDMESLVRAWFPMGVQGMEQIQKAFWSAATGALASSPSSTSPAPDTKKR
jgi:spore maturation protein SpmA